MTSASRHRSTQVRPQGRPRSRPQGLTWQLLLQASPDQVYDALHRAAGADGRIRASDEHDHWLEFSGVPGGPGERTCVRACVHEQGHGTLVEFGPSEGRAPRHFNAHGDDLDGDEADRAEAAQAASIGRLVHQMRSYAGAMSISIH